MDNMDKVEEYISKYTRHCSNELVAVENKDGKKVVSYHDWLTPENVRAAAALAEDEAMKKLIEHGYTFGAAKIAEERKRQIDIEGYDAMHDRHHTPQVLCRAAAAYALHEDPSKLVADAAAKLWPWSKDFWKPKNHIRNLIRAGALIAAAIDRCYACGMEEDQATGRKFVQSVHVNGLNDGILYVTVNISEKWVEYQLFRTYPGKGLMQISFYAAGAEYSETFKVGDGFNQFDYQITSSQEKDQITIVCIPVTLLMPNKKRTYKK